jgi:DNA-binding IclR family transcriptional regulator
MARLAREFDETLALAVWGSHGPTVTMWEPASTPVSENLPVGLILPITSTATGLAFAAHLPPDLTSNFLCPELDTRRQNTQAWESELADVRRRGLARHTLGTFYRADITINALSAPVLDAAGTAVLAMTAIGESKKFRAEFHSKFAQALKATCEDVSRRLGYVTPSGEAHSNQFATVGE